ALRRPAERRAHRRSRHAAREHLAGTPVAAVRGEHGGEQVADAGEPVEGARVRAERRAEALELAEDAPARGAGRVHPTGGGRRGREGRSVLRGAGELDADDVVRALDVDAGAFEDVAELAHEVAIGAGEDS